MEGDRARLLRTAEFDEESNWTPTVFSKSMIDRGFTLAKKKRPWTEEELRMLKDASERIDDTGHILLDKYYWISHHVMNQRRSVAECKAAIRLLAQDVRPR